MKYVEELYTGVAMEGKCEALEYFYFRRPTFSESPVPRVLTVEHNMHTCVWMCVAGGQGQPLKKDLLRKVFLVEEKTAGPLLPTETISPALPELSGMNPSSIP